MQVLMRYDNFRRLLLLRRIAMPRGKFNFVAQLHASDLSRIDTLFIPHIMMNDDVIPATMLRFDCGPFCVFSLPLT